MIPTSPSAALKSSRLIRLLSNDFGIDAAEPKGALGERLGQWLDLADAIALHAAHEASVKRPPASLSELRCVAVEEEFARGRTALETWIKTSGSPHSCDARIGLRMPIPVATLDVSVAYEPYRRFYAAHQAHLESNVRALRRSVRQALWGASPALKQLAVLDEALEAILSSRERQLLSTVPALLERRFAQLLEVYQQTIVDTRQAEDPALWVQPGGWLSTFGEELQRVLLAELHLRLKPTLGLMEALRHEAIEQK